VPGFKAKQNKTKQNKTKQNKTKQNKTKQNKTEVIQFMLSVNVMVHINKKKIFTDFNE